MAAISEPIEYRVSDSTGDKTFSGKISTALINQTLSNATDFTWKALQLTKTETKTIPTITLFIENSDGVAYTDGDEIHFNAGYLKQYFSSGDEAARREFVGVMYHEMVHVWQWNGGGKAPEGLIEGVADYVRLKAGFRPGHWAAAGGGRRWDQGYDVTARFLDYCSDLRDGFVAEMNKKMKSDYDEGLFVDLLGKTVDELWSDYKTKYGK